MMTENLDRLGEVADDIDNLLGAMALPMPPQFHLDQLRRALPEVRDRIRRIYVAEAGDNPWDTHLKD